jgi:hypothetical protein
LQQVTVPPIHVSDCPMPLNQVKVGIVDDPQRSAVLALSALSSQRSTMQGLANRGIAEPTSIECRIQKLGLQRPR